MPRFTILVAALIILASPARAQEVIDPYGTPPPGSGNGEPEVRQDADGVVFVTAPEGGVRHRLTGFVCPRRLMDFRRSKVAVFDPSEGGRDAACSFSRSRSWFTLYLTRLPGKSAEDVFETYVMQGEDASPPAGRATAPLAAGPPPLPGFSHFWRNRHDQIEGLWMAQIGDWHVKLRVTYSDDDENDVATFAQTLFRQIHEQIGAPEI